MTNEAYGAFAYAFDKALGERFFKAMRVLLDETLERYPTTKHTHLDVGCGTGLALEYFRARGWKSIGVDLSLPMLRLARKQAIGHAVTQSRGHAADSAQPRDRATANPFLIAADMRALPLRGPFARITCLYDSLNHLIDTNDLVAAFKAIRAVMEDDSLLLFDMNHPDIYPAVWGDVEPFIAIGPDYKLEMATTFRKREGIGRAFVTGWATIGGERVKIREQHRQRAYTEREIVAALAKAGLAPVDVLDFDPYQESERVDAETVKLFFVVSPRT